MPTKLTKKEADMLISMLKKTVEKEVAFPQRKGRVEFDVAGDRRDDLFAINISRKGINATGASYQGRIRTSGHILMRLDINPTQVHINPNGDKITGTHLHVYSEKYEMNYATLFDIEDKDLYQLCIAFFEQFNIIEQPNLSQQLVFEEV